ncbi:MAG: hypothetical protein HN403_17205 [Rhodospirillales bacterium]|nr:hypothetical protein [Rhodospirillales bacterium]
MRARHNPSSKVQSYAAPPAPTMASQAAHKLKSSSRSVGANDLANLCQTLEAAANRRLLIAHQQLRKK